MPNYLQDILDRSMAVADAGDDPWGDKKKKKFGPLNTDLQPEEQGTSPLFRRIAQNIEAFGQAKPYAPGEDPSIPPILRPDRKPPVEMLTQQAGIMPTPLPPLVDKGEVKPAPVASEVDGSKTDQPPDTQQKDDQAGIPTRAQTGIPTQGQGGPLTMQADPQQEPSFAGALGGLGKWLQSRSGMLMGMSAGFLGAPTLAQGMGRAMAYAGPARQQDIAQQTQFGGQQAAYNALILAGVPRDLAIAGATNPKIMDKLVDNYFVDRKTELKDIQLPNGDKMTVRYNPYTQEVTDLEGKPINLSNVPGSIDPNLHGQDAIDAAAKADPQRLAHAMALIEGRERWPVGRAQSAPGMKQALELARQIDPTTLDEGKAAARYQTIVDYGPKGKTGGTRLALSNMMGHAEQLDQLNKVIANWDLGGESANKARDWIKQHLGTDKTYLDAKGQADILRHLLAGEANMAFSGSHAVTGTREFLEELGKNLGHTQQHAAIKGMIHAAGTRLGELQSQFDSSMNTRSEGFHMLSPKAQKIFQKWEGDRSGMDFTAKAPRGLEEVADPSGAFADVTGAAPAAAAAALPRVSSPAEASKLPSGTHFLDPNGVERIRP